MNNKAFLYIDILGFSELVKNNSPLIRKIFNTIDSLHVHRDIKFRAIIFSDTVLIFSDDRDSDPIHILITYLVEYAQLLFYRLNYYRVYFRAILTIGEFNCIEFANFIGFYGMALINSYNAESTLRGFGLYVDKSISNEVFIFDKINYDEKYDYVILCQSMYSLYKDCLGILPVNNNLLTETDTYSNLKEELRFFQDIYDSMNTIDDKRIQMKYHEVYKLYKSYMPTFFEKFEELGFTMSTICPCILI